MSSAILHSAASSALDSFLASLAPRRADRCTVVAAPLPPELVRAITEGGLPALRRASVVSWEHAASGTRLFGIGVAGRWYGPRSEGIEEARVALSGISFEAAGEILPAARPRLFGGLAFEQAPANPDPEWEPFGGWQFILPRVIVAEVAEGEFAATACVASGATVREPAAARADHARGGLDAVGWQRAVASARTELESGAYRKTVLARQKRVSLPGFTPEPAVSELASRYPGCFVWHFDVPGATWLGASPERLVATAAGCARADSLAASCRRGASPAEDAVLAEGLLADPKERLEHAVVVEAITSGLQPFAESIECPPGPRIMKLANIQHLHTPVTARLKPGVHVLDLVGAMHPTPAVGGWPRQPALDAIRRLEKMDRGWYAAPFGWVDFAGEGEFAVGLRTARVVGDDATLFAGCGIVADSDPEREVAETELKFRPLAEALQAGR